MPDDPSLLRRFAQTGDPDAFRELVARHIDLVYSVALRQLNGDTHLAQDVAQSVFTDFARKARSLPRDVVLNGWLYEAARFTAIKAVRSERRRQAREQEAFAMHDSTTESTPDWEQLRSILDTVMGELSATDRNALLLRFFDRQDFRAIGTALGVSDDAAQKRVARSLAKLRAKLIRRGVTLSATVLAATITSGAVQAAPVGLAASVSAASLAGASTAAATGIYSHFLQAMLTTKSKIIVAVVATAAVITPLVIQHRANQMLREQVSRLSGLLPLEAENRRLAGQLLDEQQRQQAELLQLRAKRLSYADAIAALRTATRQPLNKRNDAIRDVVRSIDPTVIPRLLQDIDKVLPPATVSSVRGLLFGRWAETDAAAAMAGANALPALNDRGAAISAVMNSWATTDLKAAVAWMQGLPQGPMVENCFTNLSWQWIQMDPAGVASYLSGMTPGVLRNHMIPWVAGQWANIDPKAALAWIDSLNGEELRKNALRDIIATWASYDPKSAVEFATNLPSSRNRNDTLNSIISQWAASDPKAAAEFVPQIRNAWTETFLLNIVERWVRSDPRGAAEFVRKMERDTNSRYLVPVAAAALVDVDPKEALAFVETLPADFEPFRLNVFGAIAERWSNHNLAEAVGWAKGLTDEKIRQSAFQAMSPVWTQADPVGAMNFALTLKPEGRSSITTTAMWWATQNPSEASEWVRKLPAGEGRSSALEGIISGWAKNSPVDAARFAAGLTDPKEQESAALASITPWAQNDPVAAARWVAEFPEGTLREHAARALVGNWFDPIACGDWIDSLPSGKTRDAAVEAIVNMWSISPRQDIAARWVGQLRDEQMRYKQTEYIAKNWIMVDRKSAETWLQSTSLPEDRKNKILGLKPAN